MLRENLEAVKVNEDFLGERKKPKRQVVFGTTQQTVEEALKHLANSNILSMPVYLNTEQKDVAFIDTVSIVQGFVTSFDSAHASSLTRDLLLPKVLSDYLTRSLSSIMADMPKAPVIELGKVTLAQVIELFSTTWRLHRVPLFDDVGIVSILSQSDIVRYFADHQDTLSSVWNLPISETKWLEHQLTKIPPITTPWEAIVTLNKCHISSVPIVEGKKLAGAFSDVDLRGFTRDNWMLLKKPMKNFTEFRNTEVHKVLYNQTVGDVILAFSTKGAHALFLVDEEDSIKGLVTLTDVISLVYSHLK